MLKPYKFNGFTKASGMLKIIKVVLCILLITACTPMQIKDVSLSGSWILTTTDGTTYPVTIHQLSPEQIVINANEVFLSGRYSVAEGRITSVELNQPRVKDIEFVRSGDDRYFLTQAPPSARFGIQLKESSLSRSTNTDK